MFTYNKYYYYILTVLICINVICICTMYISHLYILQIKIVSKPGPFQWYRESFLLRFVRRLGKLGKRIEGARSFSSMVCQKRGWYSSQPPSPYGRGGYPSPGPGKRELAGFPDDGFTLCARGPIPIPVIHLDCKIEVFAAFVLLISSALNNPRSRLEIFCTVYKPLAKI